ncbi:translation initiation factor IF-2 N-terminal domain-containing protein [Pseudonocardia adelaidensis]|uniref:S1 motif domain-containing protein n=1 Tax=Pseudonocardia adelaidensis TaxID=648754 RepID=A0ABP9NHZ7_9PSEU
MSNTESPAGTPGGPVTVPAPDDLPERMRVHALARRLARTSREVLAALASLGVEVRSAQSSVDRKVAEQVAATLESREEQPATREAAAQDAGEPEQDASAAESGAALAPVFAPPTPLFQAPTRASRKRAEPEPVERPAEAQEAESADAAPAAAEDDGDDSDDGTGRRRRRRGRRGRGRGRGADGTDDETAEDTTGESGENGEDDESEADTEDEPDDEGEQDDTQGDGEGATSRRRRRRRRRRGSGDDAADTGDEADPPNTVTRVRTPREAREAREDEGDGVQSVRGSTRLEAKRQRRRDGRDAGRRRAPILSEAEFLARRESVDRSMVVRERGDRVEIAVLEDDVLVEHFVNSTGGRDSSTGKSLVGNIYLGRVQNVLPSMEAAFVDIGRGRNAVLYAGEVDWDAAGLGGKQRRIEQALASGDSVLVQVTKDPIGHKGARLTTQISLAGRFLVYVPSGGAAGISRKLPDVERKRLKDMLKEIVPSEAGVIIRTASEGVSQEALERDVRRLQAQWEVVKGKAEASGPNKPKAPTLLYEEPDLLIKVVRDQFNEDFSRLIVEGDDAWDTLSNYVGHVAPELADRLHRHVGPNDAFAEYRIDDQLLKALDRKVWLPSGGTLVIDRTEAMTVIDVNTGKFTGSGGNLEETVTRNNLEAAEEIVRQLRLRDIGGIIVIDFIDMVLEANRDLVLRRLTECLARDRTRHQVAEVTSLGLVQMTRKRVGGGLLEHFSTPCEHCRGRGVIVNAEPVTAGGRQERLDRPERERDGRRPRGRGRREGDDRNGHDVRKAEPVAANGHGTRNGSPAEAATAAVATGTATTDASVDVGAPAPVVTPAVLDPAPPVSPEAPAAEPAAAEPAAPVGRRIRRSSRRGVVETSPAAGPVDVAADAVEEVVVERSVAVTQADADVPERTSSDQAGSEQAAGEPATSGPAEADEAAEERPRRRRGRVARTAGAPSATAGDAPVATVVTVPSPAEPAAAPTAAAASVPPVSVPPQPEPVPAARPRRARRAASRPAGPPAGEPGGDPA